MKELKTGKKKKRRKKKKRSKMSKKEATGENPKNKKPEPKYHQCLLREITDIDRHVRQSCDSLAALLQRSRLCQKTKSFSNKEAVLSNNEVNGESEETTSPWGVDDVTNWSFDEVEEIADDGLSPQDKYQTSILINDIQKELVSLMEMVPYVSKTVNGLVKIFIHYKDCTSCHDKIKPALPWILSRIQKLVKYIVVKKNKPYTKKSECSYNQNPPKPDNKKEVSEVSKKDSVRLAILQKVEGPVLSGAVPGILIQLEVKPPLPLKKYLLNAKNVKVINTSKKLHHVEEFKESQINPVVQILKAEQANRVQLKKKQQIVKPRVKNHFTRIQFVFPISKVNSNFLLSIKKKFLTVKEIKTPNNSSEFQLYEIEGSGFVEKINEKFFSGKENVLTFPEVLRELLSKSDAKMQVEKVKELEAEVKGLKDLMLEVHKNQIDLNKLMVEKGINSNTIEFSDSSRTVEKPPSLCNEKFTSNESLQNAIENLRKKCDLKNRMIVTLLKSLQKDVPSEWWEQLLDYAFDESKELDDADSEKAKNFLQQTSVYLIQADGTSAARQQPRREENSSEEFKKKNAIRCTFTTTTTTTTTKRNHLSSNPKLRTDIVTKVEELPDNSVQTRVIPVESQEIQQRLTSAPSFVKKILSKDTIEGGSVGLMFETLKKAKTNINLLCESNNEINKKLTFLHEAIKNSAAEMKTKEGDLKKFLSKITEVQKPSVSRLRKEDSELSFQRKKSEAVISEDSQSFKSAVGSEETSLKEGCSGIKSGPELFDEKSLLLCENDSSRLFLNEDKSKSRITIEDVLSAFLASSFELERNNFFANELPQICQLMAEEMFKNCREAMKIEKCGGDLNTSNASLQILSNVYDSYSRNSDNSFELKEERAILEEKLEELESCCSHLDSIPENFEFCVEEPDSCAEDDAVSENDSVFEEALSDPFPTHLIESSISKTKKSLSSLADSSDSFSWIKKLKDDIKVKIKNLTEKVTANEESNNDPKFLLTTENPIGIFDLTLRQFEEKGNVVEFDYNKVPAYTVAPVTTIISEKSVKSNHGNETMKTPSEEDKENGNKIKNTENLMTSSVVSRKPSFFEIVVCTPKFFAQEMVQKTAVHKENIIINDRTMAERGRRALDLLTENGFFLNTVDFARGSDCNPKILIQDSSHDYVIYIQVEEEKLIASLEPEENQTKNKSESESISCEVPANANKSLTSDKETTSSSENENQPKTSTALQVPKQSGTKKLINEMSSIDEIPVKIIKKIQATSTMSSLDIGKEIQKVMKSKIPFLINGEVDSILSDGMRTRTETSQDFAQEGGSKEVKPKSVKFTDEFTEVLEEKEIRQLFPEPETPLSKAVVWILMDTILRAEVLYPQTEVLRLNYIENKKPGQKMFMVYETFDSGEPELFNALNLIHKLENDVNEVKLRDAILILPQLESELRKHLQGKMKEMKSKCSVVNSSIDNFFSAVEFWPNLVEEERRDDSEERLQNLLRLLSHLEEAIKADDTSKDKLDLCSFNSSKVYELLHALTNSIRELEEQTTMVSLAETLEIASQLDNAVREYDSIVKKEPTDYVRQGVRLLKGHEKGDEWTPEELVVKDHLKNVRKRVFEIVEGEAEEVEERIEKDFDRVDRLEKQNEEALKFIEAFLEKTQRRAGELESAKVNLKHLTRTLDNMYSSIITATQKRKRDKLTKMIEKLEEQTAEDRKTEQRKVEEQKEEERKVQERVAEEPRADKPENVLKSSPSTTMKDTVSSLLLALDKLKSKAKQKNKVCMEILGIKPPEENTNSRQSKSSSATQEQKINSVIKEIKKIGHNSLYMTWAPPEGIDLDSLLGYEILVNGKVNQRVRNPKRLQAVLYSVTAEGNLEIHLYALVDDSKILVGTINL